jgi:hypothetical protein
MSDLGDIGQFLKEGNVSNLDWLEVDPAEYRAQQALPKQNLDVQPDLEALWAHQDESPTKYVANKADVPRTMGDLSQEHGHLRAKPEEIMKVARLALMQSSDLNRFKDALVKRFDLDSLKGARSVLASVLAERGLLGHFYISASDFPACDSGTAKPSAFVKRYANGAKYVLAKPQCTACIHHVATTAGETCSVFHKEIKVELPYTDALAAEVEKMQRSKGKDLSKTASKPKERIRLAMLADDFEAPGPAPMPKPKDNVVRLLKPVEAHTDYQRPINLTPMKEAAKAAVSQAFATGRFTVQRAQSAYRSIAAATDPGVLQAVHVEAAGAEAPELAVYCGAGSQQVVIPSTPEVADQQLIAASNLTRKRDEEMNRVMAARKAEPVLAMLRREMLKGRNKAELIGVLKHAFTVPDLEATRAHWEPLFREAGLFGAIYTTQDAFDDCKEGANLLATYNPSVKGVVAGKKCGGCIYSKIGRCLMYGKPLVKTADELYTNEIVEQVAQEAKSAGFYGSNHTVWGKGQTNRQILAIIHTVVTTHHSFQQTMPGHRMAKSVTKGHVMNRSDTGGKTSDLTIREISKAASKFLNEGLYGRDLLSALKSRFDPRDLVAATPVLKSVIAEQGLQGIHYVDPAVYEDYGQGCKEASRLHRSRLVPYVKFGSKCVSCVHQSRAGFCSVINKPLVEEPPYVDKVAQQREVLTSGASTRIDLASLVQNGASMMAEYQMQNGGMDFDLNEKRAIESIGIEFNNQGVKL